MDIMSVPWNVVFMCSINDQVQKSKLVHNSFSRTVKHSRTFWLVKVRTRHCLEMSITDWHSVINKKNEIFLSKALLYIVLIMCQVLVCYTTDVVSNPYSDGASTFIWNVKQFFQIPFIGRWEMIIYIHSKYKILIESVSWKVEYVHAKKFCRIKGNCLLENEHGLDR
jgi:hypothetical protein